MEYEKWTFVLPPYKIEAFTLAEVLITLVIIGVIAAITVPTLMNNTNGEEYKSALKKAISAVNQAFALHFALEGEGAQEYSTAQDVINNIFKKRMNVVDFDYTSLPNDYNFGEYCYPTAENSFVTQDGIIYCVNSDNWQNGDSLYDDDEYNAPCNIYNTKSCSYSYNFPNLFIDVNGLKKPNTLTTNSLRPRDQYYAEIYNTKVEPLGSAIDIMSGAKGVNVGKPVIPK